MAIYKIINSLLAVSAASDAGMAGHGQDLTEIFGHSPPTTTTTTTTVAEVMGGARNLRGFAGSETRILQDGAKIRDEIKILKGLRSEINSKINSIFRGRFNPRSGRFHNTYQRFTQLIDELDVEIETGSLDNMRKIRSLQLEGKIRSLQFGANGFRDALVEAYRDDRDHMIIEIKVRHKLILKLLKKLEKNLEKKIEMKLEMRIEELEMNL